MIKIVKGVFLEIFIISLYALLINFYLGKDEITMKGDGIGYYDYLPSTFIYHDIIRKNYTAEHDSNLYERISKFDWYVKYKDYRLNKYPCGTAVLESPFFFYTFISCNLRNNGEEKIDGYQLPFQKTVFYAAIFYLFLSLLFLAALLRLYHIGKWIIFITQILFVFATGLLLYASFDAGFSHIYSMFAITAFVYFSKSYINTKSRKDFLLASVFLGLVIILRQINVVIILFIPFLAGSFDELKKSLVIFKDYKAVILSILIFTGLFSIQSFFWYAQTGDFIVYSYQGEGFNFLKPEILNILFSYKKGLFIYTPVLLISLFGLVFFLFRKQFYLFITWLLFFAVLTYFLSSWHAWWYGASFGQRAYIDFYVIFFLLFGIFLDSINKPLRIVVLLFSLFTIPVNIIQTYQYKSYILHWINMDKKKYWEVFLQTSDKYRGLLWKKSTNFNSYTDLIGFNLGDLEVEKDKDTVIFELYTDSIKEFNQVNIAQLKIENDFSKESNARVIFTIKDIESNKFNFWHSAPLIHFKETDFELWQTGIYNFTFQPITDQSSKLLQIYFVPNGAPYELKNVNLRFYKNK